MRSFMIRLAAAAGCLTVCNVALGHELLVSMSANNAIQVELINGPVYELPASEFPEFPGFVDFDPGFVALPVDDPATGRFELPAGSDIEFLLVGADDHIQVWNDTGTAPMNIGDTFSIGVPQFHSHPTWHSPDGTPGEQYNLFIQLRDRNGLVANSPVTTVGFMPVPEPSSLALMVLAGTAIAFSRRSHSARRSG